VGRIRELEEKSKKEWSQSKKTAGQQYGTLKSRATRAMDTFHASGTPTGGRTASPVKAEKRPTVKAQPKSEPATMPSPMKTFDKTVGSIDPTSDYSLTRGDVGQTRSDLQERIHSNIGRGKGGMVMDRWGVGDMQKVDPNEGMPGGDLRDMPVWDPADPYSTTGWSDARKAEERMREDYRYAMYTFPKIRGQIASSYFGKGGLGEKELEKAIAGMRGGAAERVAQIGASAQVESAQISADAPRATSVNRYSPVTAATDVGEDKLYTFDKATGTYSPQGTQTELSENVKRFIDKTKFKENEWQEWFEAQDDNTRMQVTRYLSKAK